MEPGKTDPMRAALIIANLLVDNNLLVVRTPGMAIDEHLVAVDYAGVVDFFRVNDMRWSDSKEWISLNLKWNTLIRNSVLLNLFRYVDSKDFYDIFRLITFLMDHKINKNLN